MHWNSEKKSHAERFTRRGWGFMEKLTSHALKLARRWTQICAAYTITLAIFLLLISSGCSTVTGGSLNIAYPDRPPTPTAIFKDEGQHCISDEELNSIGEAFIETQRYIAETEGIIDAVNGR